MAATASDFMRLAIAEAEKGVGRTHPNPAVGAVLVKQGRVIASGYHPRAGEPHAEVVVLRAAGARARGAELYVTLEPCNHYGRTPPCSEAILAAGVKRVVCASADPNPLVRGKGVARLRRGGVRVQEGLLREEANRLNEPFFKYLRTGLPWVTLKAAITLDGQMAAKDGSSQWVTGVEARAFGHRLRDRHDVIVVGSGTVARDDPRLTTRLIRAEDGAKGRDALRIVLDSRLRLKPTHRIFNQRSPATTVVATLRGARSRVARALIDRGVEVWTVPARAGHVDVEAVLRRVTESGLRSVLVEGGPRIHAAFLRGRWADAAYLFMAPKLLGQAGFTWSGDLGVGRIKGAVPARWESLERVGEDALLQLRF